MTKLEEVARAIYEKRNGKGCYPWSLRTKSHRDPYLSDARAAIEAMREPDVEMIAAFWRQKNTGTQEIGETGEDRSDYAAWRAAIDAALSEGKETET